MNRCWLSLFTFLVLIATVCAQENPHFCISSHKVDSLAEDSPQYRAKRYFLDRQWTEHCGHRDHQSPSSARRQYTLPIVFHVVHNNGPENIPDAQVLQALSYLNDAFANVGYYDQQTGLDMNIQFCRAMRDPENMPTTGITRIQSALTNMTMETDDIDLKNLRRWNPLDYINVWIVNEITSVSSGSGVAGYALFPAAHGGTNDGIVVEAKHTGVDESYGAILVHEMGHYLGLYHTFEGGCQNDDCAADGDLICDTPPDQSTAYTSCASSMNTCHSDINSGFSTDENDMIENYMDYSDLTCYNQFTPLQRERMHFSIEQARNTLLNSLACNSPCENEITADFNFPATIPICDSATINNLSTNADLFYWYLNDTLISSRVEPKIYLTYQGVHTLKLIAYSADSTCRDVYEITFTSDCPIRSEIINTIPACITSIDSTIVLDAYVAADYSFEWFLNDVYQSSAPSLSFVYPAGSHDVTLISYFGKCIDSTTVILSIGCEEICDNERDDDGDGLIDCFDDDCCGICPNFYYDPCAPEECLTIGEPIDIQESWRASLGFVEIYSATTADMTGDGDIELVCYTSLFNPGFVIISHDGVIEDNISWSTPFSIDDRYTHATADVDRDGDSELFFLSRNLELVRVEHDGTETFVSDPVTIPNIGPTNYGDVVIADLNFDKRPEIIFAEHIIDSWTGDILFTPSTSFQTSYASDRHAIADILDDDFCAHCRGQELIYGTRIYAVSEDNSIVEIASEISGYTGISTAVADWDLDGDEDVIATCRRAGQIHLMVWNGQTSDILYNTVIRNTTSGIIVGNFDLDPAPEVVIVESDQPYGVDSYIVLRDNDFNQILEQYEFNLSLCTPGAFDFNRDNIQEIFYRAQDEVRIINTLDGSLYTEAACYSFTNAERPFIADIDKDGAAELITTCMDDVVVYEGVRDWPGTRSVCNQYTFDNPHINDDHTVPAYYQKPILPNHQGEFNGAMSYYRIREEFKNEFTLKHVRAFCDEGKVAVILDVCQYQNLLGDSVAISIYTNHPNGPTSTIDTTVYYTFSTLNWDCIHDTIYLEQAISQGDSIVVLLNDDGSVSLPFDPTSAYPITSLEECDYTDNVLATPVLIEPLHVNQLEDTSFCSGDALLLSITDDWMGYLWNTGDTTASTTISAPGWHWVALTPYCGMEVIDSFYVSEYQRPALSLADTISDCLFGVHVLDAGSGFASYKWSNGTDRQTMTVFAEGTYWVEVVDSCGHTERDSSVVLFPDLADPMLPDTLRLCRGDSAQVQLALASAAAWSPATAVSCIDCIDPYIYSDTSRHCYVSWTNADGCGSTDSIFIDVVRDIEVQDTILACDSDSAFYRGIQYIKGNHDVRVSSSSCDTLIKLVVRQSDISFTLSSHVAINPGETIFVPIYGDEHTIQSAMWSPPDDVLCVTCPDFHANPQQATTYSLTIIGTAGCLHELAIHVSLIDQPNEQVYVPNVFSPNSDGINDSFALYGDAIDAILSFEIYNRWGGKVYDYRTLGQTRFWDGTIKGKNAAEGVYAYRYMLRLTNGDIKTSSGSVMLIR